MLGDPLPGAVEVLPAPEVLQCCSVDEGDKDAPPPSCAHCGQGDRPGESLLQTTDGGEFVWLHQACIDAYARAAA